MKPLVFFGAKGGVGCSLAACTSAFALSLTHPVTLIDLAGGDLAIMLGVPSGATLELSEHLELRQLDDPRRLGDHLDALADRHVVIDVGRWDDELARLGRSVLVLRPTHLDLHHARRRRPDQLLVINQPDATVDLVEIAAHFDAPVAGVEPDPRLARAANRGHLLERAAHDGLLGHIDLT